MPGSPLEQRYVTLFQHALLDHPSREIRKLTDLLLASLSAAFDEILGFWASLDLD
jgi:hypothetical protein